VIKVRLSASDLNQLLARIQDARVVFRGGCFQVQKKLGPLNFTLRAYPDLRDGRVRLAVPFDEVSGEGVARFAGGLAPKAWAWLEAKLESVIADKLADAGLPWDVVWLDRIDDPRHGGTGTLNVAPRTLNEWLRRQPWLEAQALRLAAIEVDNDGLTLELALVEGAATARVELGSRA
jgi:hypothetical protein